jgi:hypothetical protein
LYIFKRFVAQWRGRVGLSLRRGVNLNERNALQRSCP